MDYTPISELDSVPRQAEWRRRHRRHRQASESDAIEVLASLALRGDATEDRPKAESAPIAIVPAGGRPPDPTQGLSRAPERRCTIPRPKWVATPF